jgi:hypothetical protein
MGALTGVMRQDVVQVDDAFTCQQAISTTPTSHTQSAPQQLDLSHKMLVVQAIPDLFDIWFWPRGLL